jgi:transposase
MNVYGDLFPWLGRFTMTNTTPPTLFPMPEATPDAVATPASSLDSAPPRLRQPERFQISMHCESLEQRLPADHRVRDIWDFVNGLDMTPLLRKIKAVEGQAGRDATDPKILMAIWLWAFAEGQGNARAVARLCSSDRAYEWLCGGVTVNYHLLASFRVDHWDYLNQLFTDSLAALQREGVLDLKRTAQDGMRVQASAGKSSFRRPQTLKKCLAEAQARVAQLNQDFENGAAATAQEKAARERAARERVDRVQDALNQVQELARQREARQKGSGETARASTTDPDARNMKMPDGGFRPAYNVQFTTDTASGLIVGVDANNQGTDAGLMDPMLEQVQQRTGQIPEEHLADGGFATIDDIEKVTARGTTVFTPLKEVAKKQAAGIDPYQPQPDDSPPIADWRQRMGTQEAQAIYKLRAQTAEWTNAQARNRNFYRVRVRGLHKVQMIALWYALIHNLLGALRLRAERAQAAANRKPAAAAEA